VLLVPAQELVIVECSGKKKWKKRKRKFQKRGGGRPSYVRGMVWILVVRTTQAGCKREAYPFENPIAWSMLNAWGGMLLRHRRPRTHSVNSKQ